VNRPSAPTRVAVLILLFALIVFAFGRLVPGAEKRLGAADPAWIAVAVTLELTACLGYVLLFHGVFARTPYRLGFGRSARIALGELAGYVLAPGGIGGPAVRVWMLRKGGMPWRAIGTRSVTHAAVFNAPYLAAALVFGVGLALRLTPGRASLVVELAPVTLVIVALLAVAGAAAASRMRWLQVPSSRRRTVRAALETIPDGVRELPHFLRHPAALLGATVYWVGDCAVLWASFQAVGGSPAIGILVVGYMLGQLGNALPLPGGIGGVEPLMLGILTASGVDAAPAAAAIICYRAISLGIQSVAGAIAVTSSGVAVEGDGRPRPEPQAGS
jgi:uncharacterized protein (TIRG00374 family)